jgi:hypothetical protein
MCSIKISLLYLFIETNSPNELFAKFSLVLNEDPIVWQD